ncbi:MAG: hypothetical protein JXB06_04045, partial [Spirochaetales bacterium]|nr:hypothetical protein [Spirochaetales bacterium]
MMIDRVRDLLGRFGDVSAWRISDRQIEGKELFFIHRDVDMQRCKDVRHISLTIYRDFLEGKKSYRGSVSVQIHPTHTDEEIRRLIEQSLDSARHVHNEHYPLVEPGSRIQRMPDSSFAGRALEAWLAPLAEAIYAQEEEEQAGINSVELFINRSENRILNSQGLDVAYTAYSGYVELIAEDGGKAEDGRRAGGVELYREISLSEYEPQFLAAEVRRQLRYCSDRAAAAPTPHLKRADVLITGDPVPDFFRYYLTQSAAQSVYSGLSTAKVGQCLQGEGISGDGLSLSLEPFLHNSTASAPVDADGFALSSTSVFDAGKLERYWGPLRFCHYLGVPATGSIGNVRVSAGSRSVEQLRSRPHLEVVYFSDFVSEPLTGDFGGEIRLAYYTDPRGDRRIVTG